MAGILTCDMSELPPEIQQQLMEEQRQDGAAAGRQEGPGDWRQEGAAAGRQEGAQTAEQSDQAGGKTKRNALKRREKAAAQPKDELVSMNVRLTREAYDAVADLSDEYGVSKAAVIRAALSGNMGDYFGGIRFSDPAQGVAIQDGIARLTAASADIGRQLNRIGKNYNAALRLAYAMSNQGEAQVPLPELDKDAVAGLVDRYAAAAERLGEVIWLIQK